MPDDEAEQVLQIVRTSKDGWLVMEEKPHPLSTDLVVHYLKGRTRQGPKLIKVIDPFEDDTDA